MKGGLYRYRSWINDSYHGHW